MPNVSDLSTGEKFDAFFRIRDLQKKETRNGRQYLDLVLEDRTGGISAKVWEVEEQVLGVIERGDFVKARAVVESYKGNFQLRVQKIRKVNDEDYEEGFRQEECIEQTPFDIDLMWEEIRRIARTCHPLVADFLMARGPANTSPISRRTFGAYPLGDENLHIFGRQIRSFRRFAGGGRNDSRYRQVR